MEEEYLPNADHYYHPRNCETSVKFTKAKVDYEAGAGNYLKK